MHDQESLNTRINTQNKNNESKNYSNNQNSDNTENEKKEKWREDEIKLNNEYIKRERERYKAGMSIAKVS
jgi:hypothetical protein